MHDTVTTIILVLLACLSLAASIGGILALRRRVSRDRRQFALVCMITVGCAGLFLYRELLVHKDWLPLAAHVDGLLMIATLFGGAVMYLQSPERLPGISAFAAPLLALLLLWTICASHWTLVQFKVETVVKSVHLATVYLGTFLVAVAGIASGMYLHGQHRLRRKEAPTSDAPFASLEAIERIIIRSAALGFVLLTVAMVTGLIITDWHSEAGPKWLVGWKLALTVPAWLMYAAVMNVRLATTFRGARAAWLSITGVVLLLATFGLVSSAAQNRTTINDPPPMSVDGLPGAPIPNGEKR